MIIKNIKYIVNPHILDNSDMKFSVNLSQNILKKSHLIVSDIIILNSTVSFYGQVENMCHMMTVYSHILYGSPTKHNVKELWHEGHYGDSYEDTLGSVKN